MQLLCEKIFVHTVLKLFYIVFNGLLVSIVKSAVPSDIFLRIFQRKMMNLTVFSDGIR